MLLPERSVLDDINEINVVLFLVCAPLNLNATFQSLCLWLTLLLHSHAVVKQDTFPFDLLCHAAFSTWFFFPFFSLFIFNNLSSRRMHIFFSFFFFWGEGGVISVGYCCWYCRTALALLFDLLYCLGNSSASGKIYLPNSWCFCFLQSIDMTILPSKLGCDLCNLIHSRGCFLETLELTGIDCLLLEFFYKKKKARRVVIYISF